MPALAVVAASQPVGLAVAVVLALAAASGGLATGSAAIAAAGGAAGAAGLALFYRAMAIGPMGIVAPVAAMGVLVPVAVGLFRGEEPAALEGVGLLLAVCGIALAVREAERPHAAAVAPGTIAMAALAGACFGTVLVALDAAAADDPLWALVALRVGGTAAVLAVALPVLGRLRPPPRSGPPLVAIGVLDVSANALFAFATREGLLTLVAVAGSLYPVVAVLLARIVLGERLARLQRIGVALALTGVVVIAAG